MTAVWLWVRGDLRRRWLSWTVLGVLAGISVGLACAGVAGARRTEHALPTYVARSRVPDAILLANDWAFDEQQQARVAALREVTGFHPFLLPILLEVAEPAGMPSPLLSTTPSGMESAQTPPVEGRLPHPDRVDEMAINEQARDAFGLEIGSTVRLVQHPPGNGFLYPVPPGSDEPIDQPVRVVGILNGAGSSEPDAVVSSAFYQHYRDQLVGLVNAMVDLERDAADLDRFRADVDRLMQRPINVESPDDLFGLRQHRNAADIESDGLLLFALAVLVGAGALVGQALVRAVAAGAADLGTWRAIGADRALAVRAMVAPSAFAAAVAAATTIVVGALLSPRFPIGNTRQFDIDTGVHADWTVLAVGSICVMVVVLLIAWVAAEVTLRRDRREGSEGSPRRWTTGFGLSPALTIGSRLATETGRGTRSVPVRSALIGAIAGVLGVVACLTFRSGLSDAVADPSRSGVVWDFEYVKAGLLTDTEIAQIVDDPVVASSLQATWARALSIEGTATPTFGMATGSGDVAFKVLEGSAPDTADEIAFAPSTMDGLGVEIGDRVTVGVADTSLVVVGRMLLPGTSHTSYDQSAVMTRDGLMEVLGSDHGEGDDFFEDYLLLAWRAEVDVSAAQARIESMVDSDDGIYFASPARVPHAVDTLNTMRVLPLALAVFFGLLAIATVAHALATTVKRRRADLAILRSIGFTKRDARLAVAWQATLLAMAGVVVGVPLGIVVGRLMWKQFAENFPVVYAPPLAVLAVVLAAPIAVALANALALGPARNATRLAPAEVLRSE